MPDTAGLYALNGAKRLDMTEGNPMIKAEWKGLDTLQRNLRRLGDRARALDGTHKVPIGELLDPGFIRSHVRGCSTVDEWLQASGFKIESTDDFKAIPDAGWDAYVRSSTPFLSWADMLKTAGAEFVKRRLFG